MQISSVNVKHSCQANKKTNSNISFKGDLHKSVYRYLDYICPESANANALKNEIIAELKTFMAPLHKDTFFAINDIPAVRSFLLPFSPYKARELVFIEDYQTSFFNKKINTSFSLSERLTCVRDKDKSYAPPSECVLRHPLDCAEKLSAFKSHVDAVIKFFDKDRGFDVDNVLFNRKLKNRPLLESYLPEFIVRRRIEKDKKLAPEFQRFFSNDYVYIFNFVV